MNQFSPPIIDSITPQTLVASAPAVQAVPWLDTQAFPFRQRRIRVEGHALAYVDEGKGPPIVFVHGTPSWSFEWRHCIAALSTAYRCIAVDHLGFGLSDKPASGDYAPADHARRLLAVLRALDVRNVTLVVHDFGGPIGLWAAQQEPARIASIAAMNTWAWSLAGDRTAVRLSRVVRSGLGRLLYLRLNASPRWLLPASFADRSKLTPEIHAQYMHPFDDPQQRRGPWALGCELAAPAEFYDQVWEGLPALADKPWRLIWGGRDPAFGEAQLQRLLSVVPRAGVVRLQTAGHFPQEEDPTQVVEAIRMAAKSAPGGLSAR